MWITVMLLSFLAACENKKDNTVYKPLDTEMFSCKLYGVETREEQYDQGVMTPLDGKFMRLRCTAGEMKDKPDKKTIETIDQKIENGVIHTKDFGPVHVTFHGPSSSGLYDGVVSNSWGYEAINMQSRFYMTDYQVHEIKKFLKEK